MFQMDFEAFYDAIPLPENCRNFFVFRNRSGAMYRLTTLPTGARWSVAVGQAITSMIVDTGLPVIVETMIDNILVAAEEGQEDVFCQAVRLIVHRIAAANLLISPPREEIMSWSEDSLLRQARGDCVFLGEEYSWIDGQRQVRNSCKTVAPNWTSRLRRKLTVTGPLLP
eukprot:gene12666-biopygen9306